MLKPSILMGALIKMRELIMKILPGKGNQIEREHIISIFRTIY